jgi:hypothetical protein
MARILEYQQQTRATTPVGSPALPVDNTLARGLTQTFEGVGNDALRLQAFEKQKGEERAAVWSNDQVMNFRSRWAEELPKRQQAAPEGADGFTLQTLKDFDEQATDAVKAAPSERSRQVLKERLGAVRLSIQQDALGFEAQKGVEYKINGLSRATDQAKIAAEFRPQDFSALAAEQASAIEASGLAPDQRAKLTQASREHIAEASIAGMIRHNPYSALKTLNDSSDRNAAVGALSFESRQRARGLAESEIRAREAEARARQAELQQSLSNDLKDSFAARQAGLPANLPSKERFDAAFGAKSAEHYQNATASWGIFDVVAQAANENPADAQKTLAQLKPTEQSGAANATDRYQDGVKLWAQQRKQLEEDPAATLVARDPKLAALMQQATTPQGAQKYLSAIQARESALGVEKPRLLPVAYADEMARSLAFDPEKPTQRIETLQSLQAAYGKAFPKIIEEIAPKLDGHARVLVNMLPEDAKRLDAAVAQGAKTINDLLPKNNQADITTYVDQNLSGLSRTLADNPDAESRIHEHREAAQLLAGSLVLRGASPREAAKMATDAVVNNRYTFTDTARIPLPYDSRRVLEGAQAKLLDASRAPLSVAVGDRSDATAAVKDIQEHVREKGYWITNEDETGLVLRIPHRRGMGEVYDAKGKRIEYTWDELLKTRPASIEEFPSMMEWKP